MMRCDDIRAQLIFYLDDELSLEDCRSLESHLGGCSDCRAALDHERRFLDRVRSVAPIYPAPGALRRRLEDRLSVATISTARPAPAISRPHRASRMAAWAALLLLALSALWVGTNVEWNLLLRRGPSEFAVTAVEVHRRYLRGALPLEIASDDPGQVSAWFAGKLDFRLRLPDYQETSGRPPLYRIKGARLVGYRGDYAAYVAYDMGAEPISLVVTSDRVATPAGGERVVAKGLVFHHDHLAGFKVITWSDQGLTYALVSALGGRGEESCRVCHVGAGDGDKELPGEGF